MLDVSYGIDSWNLDAKQNRYNPSEKISTTCQTCWNKKARSSGQFSSRFKALKYSKQNDLDSNRRNLNSKKSCWHQQPSKPLLLLRFHASYSNSDEHLLLDHADVEVYETIRTLNENKATGAYKIPAKLLKHCALCICPSLCALFNKSLCVGKLPSEWKLSNIPPISKGSKADEATNYRPISLLSQVSKVLERCIFNKLIDHVSSQLHQLQADAKWMLFTTSGSILPIAFDKVGDSLLLIKRHLSCGTRELPYLTRALINF